jgi:5-methylcytosine-specific restriction endonuclease McrA
LIYGRQRRARKLNADGEHTFQDVKVIGDLQEWRCYYCNKDVAASYHVDHMIPLVRGESDWPDNLVVACPTCNISKGAKTAEECPGFLRDRDVQDP